MVGAGGLANIAHYPSLAAMPDVDLVGIAELNAERLQTTADKYGVAGRYGDYRELVAREKPDAVYVIMPPQHLHNIVVDLLELGVHVFVEKPPAITTYQTEALAWYASRNDRLTMVGFNRRYIKMLRRCRAAITERGPLHQCLAGFHKFEAGPDNYGYGRGAVSHLTSDIIHAVDALRWMAGGEVVAVAADNRAVDMPFVNNHNAIVTFSTGCVAILTASRRSGRRDHYFEMHGQGVSAFAENRLHRRHQGRRHGLRRRRQDHGPRRPHAVPDLGPRGQNRSMPRRPGAGPRRSIASASSPRWSRHFIDAIKAGRRQGGSPRHTRTPTPRMDFA